MKSKILPLLLCLGAFQAPALANESGDEISLLRQQLLALSERLDALENANLELKADNQRLQESHAAGKKETQASKASWTDRISFKGDFRGRFESIDEQNRERRNRNRIRARAAITAQISDQIEVGLGMASGGDDPVSTNQTLGGGGSTKGLNLDLAYLKWRSGNTTYYGGKFKNHLYKPGKNALMWDGDWTPEGLGLAWSNGDYFLNGIGTWLESDSRKETEFSWGVQAGLVRALGDGITLTAGIGYFDIGTAGKGSFFGDADDFYGNSFDPVSNTYLYDYRLLELSAELGFTVSEMPASMFVDFVRNQDAGEFDTGFAAGFTYGSAKNQGQWEFAYTYQDIEADAVFGLLTDSDFAGGGSDGKGHILKGGYALRKNVNANITYFMTERNADAGSPRDYDRLQLDLALKY